MDAESCDENIGRDWSCLNYDLTEYIFRKLPAIADLIACRKVCRSWCYVSHNRIISNLPFKSPVLVLPINHLPIQSSTNFFQHGLVDTKPYCFLNPEANKLYKLSEKSKELLKNSIFMGSSNGWALFAKFNDLIIFNAPTDTTIRFPGGGHRHREIEKALLLGDPILDKNIHDTMAILFNSGLYGLSYAQLGDRSSAMWVYPCDVIGFDGLLYALFKDGFIRAWDFIRISMDCYPCEHCYQPSFNLGKELTRSNESHLVESSGELWLVSKFIVRYKRIIRVYKMDFNRRKWVYMDSLGGRAVFLSKSQSISFLPLRSSMYKKNHVYFEEGGVYDYNLDKSSVKKINL